MPLYSYICEDCQEKTEEFRSIFRRNASLHCSKCEGKMRKLFEAPRALRTDTEFQRSIHFNDGLRNDKERRMAKQIADRMGVNIEGKRYDGRLASSPLHPSGFYGDRNEARKRCRELGMASEDLGVKPPPDENTGKPYRVADDIVERDAKETVITKHGGTVSRKKWENIKQETREQLEPSK